MAKWSVLLVALFAGASYAASSSSRIIGGQVTSIEQYPSLVQIDYLGWIGGTWSQNCAGIILNSRNVLSVAQCFSGRLFEGSRRRVRAGSSIRDSGGIISHVDQVTNHPSFDPRSLDGDISVIRLSSPFTFTPTIQQGTIVASGFEVPHQTPVLLVGWGDMTAQGGPSEQLRHVTVPTLDNGLCTERYASLNRTVTPNMICAGAPNQGACARDVGGPVYLSGITIGLISWNQGCGNGTFPGVSTAVSPYTEWIRTTAA